MAKSKGASMPKQSKKEHQAAVTTSDPQLKQAAEKAAPDVQKHLELAKQICEKMK